MKINNVLSLFDGIGCGIQSLKDSNIKFGKYYASEVDPHAMKISTHNHPEIIQVGDVRNLIGKDFKKIDLLMGGSPCQNFSFCGTRKGMVTKEGIEITTLEQYLQLKDEGFQFQGQSYLFWEFIRLLKELQPKYFLLENVRMDKKWEDLITSITGVEPMKINSSSLVPQNRFRNYWTNISVEEITGKGPVLSDFIRQAVTGVGYRGVQDPNKPIKNGKIGYTVRMQVRKDNIANAILTEVGNAQSKNGTGHYLTVDGTVKTFKSAECEILQGLPNGYTDVPGVSENKRIHGLGNGWTVPVISYIFSFIKPTVGSRKNPTWEERQEFEKERSGQPAAPWSHVPQGW